MKRAGAGLGALAVAWAQAAPASGQLTVWYDLPVSPSVVSRDPAIMGGTPVFRGTRVPVQTLLDYLEAGESLDEFLEGFPTVTRGDVIEFLEAATKQLVDASS